ncbi:class I SAM-dependent methyltransferase [Siculibacillus lacustris]|uniref:Class I SAM-dependent methyltransferase n=2 Tax=Siculibacillus lacustris TaxID=1549641 RepID=A0A4V2KTI8_9HYPH|nr:class I SAM-dependent methyltransferase [Siculibacillus lacustris]
MDDEDRRRRHSGAAPVASASPPRLDEAAVLAAYSRWAPIYDWVFGRVFDAGRKAAVEIINRRRGALLEVGVGTGITLPRYAPHLTVTGIDLSPAMLAVARRRVEAGGIATVAALHEMDATCLGFADGSFETVAVMYTITVVPHPDAVMAEVERVTAPGGEAIIVSHFASESGWRRAIETALTPFTKKLGWRPDFPIDRILGRPGFELIETKRLGLFGIFTVARLRRKAD